MRPRRFHIETLGCPKNAVDSDKIVGSLYADGLERANGVEDADVVVVNTCAFVEAAGRSRSTPCSRSPTRSSMARSWS
jgi:ribosomal protein S12 methylthiotransferase